eukprot:Gb_16137 [translate_table: standard]
MNEGLTRRINSPWNVRNCPWMQTRCINLMIAGNDDYVIFILKGKLNHLQEVGGALTSCNQMNIIVEASKKIGAKDMVFNWSPVTVLQGSKSGHKGPNGLLRLLFIVKQLI